MAEEVMAGWLIPDSGYKSAENRPNPAAQVAIAVIVFIGERADHPVKYR
jgi:hypothetical protein